MKNCWSILLLAVIIQSFTLSVLAGHHGHGSNIAHILAAGLIVQLLARGHQHHGEGRHAGGHHVHSEYSPYGQASWLDESRMSPESTMGNSAWAQRAPMDLAYQHSSYKEPLMESYNVPYFYSPPHSISQGMW